MQDFIQDGDPAIYHYCHASTTVDGQHRPKGCLLPHQSGTGTPSVPQLPLARQKLLVRDPQVRLVLSALRVFTKTLAPLIVWLRLLGVQLYVYLNDILVMEESRGHLVYGKRLFRSSPKQSL